jgi:hypothetical protein
MSAKEWEAYHRCHLTVLNWQVAALGASHALREMREDRIWRGAFASFEAYCEYINGWGKTYANDFIKFGVIVDGLKASAIAVKTLPVMECQTRPLRRLTECDRATVWQLAVQRSNGASPKAKEVTAAREVFWVANPTKRPQKINGDNDCHMAELCLKKLKVPGSVVAFFRRRAKESGIPLEKLVSITLRRVAEKSKPKAKPASVEVEQELDLFSAHVTEAHDNIPAETQAPQLSPCTSSGGVLSEVGAKTGDPSPIAVLRVNRIRRGKKAVPVLRLVKYIPSRVKRTSILPIWIPSG